MPSVAFKFEVLLKNCYNNTFYCLNANIADRICKWYIEHIKNIQNEYQLQKIKILYDSDSKKFMLIVDINIKYMANLTKISDNLIDPDNNFNYPIKIRNNNYLIIGNSISYKII